MHTKLVTWDISRVRILKEAAKKDVGGKAVAMHSLTMERDSHHPYDMGHTI